MNDWTEITVTVNSETEEAMANALCELGSNGVVQSAADDSNRVVIAGYLSDSLSIQETVNRLQTLWEELRLLGMASGGCDIHTRVLPARDWTTVWQKRFTRTPVSGRITVAPPWDAGAEESEHLRIIIEPGMAFGTGEHETTRLCLRALEREIRPGDATLDVGTGSAILSIAAARLGAASVIGVDMDAEAIENASGNIARNGVENRVHVFAGSVDHPAVIGPFRVIVSNIDSRTLMALLVSFDALLSSDGVLILSGILSIEADAVIGALRMNGYALKREATEGEWWLGVAARDQRVS